METNVSDSGLGGIHDPPSDFVPDSDRLSGMHDPPSDFVPG